MTTETRLHYIYDPLCGWCYAVAPLVKAARDVLPITLHGGGMMTGTRRQQVTPEWKAYVGPNDRQITQATGQGFGEGYWNGLLNDHSAWLDSEPPTTAVLAAERVNGAGLDMLARLYEAHYLEGLRIADEAVLIMLAQQIGLVQSAFTEVLNDLRGNAVSSHFAESRAFLDRSGGRGFPTFVLERNGTLERLNRKAFLGRPDAWQNALETMAVSVPPTIVAVEAGCGPNGCAI